jgi:hypothetical protein
MTKATYTIDDAGIVDLNPTQKYEKRCNCDCHNKSDGGCYKCISLHPSTPHPTTVDTILQAETIETFPVVFQPLKNGLIMVNAKDVREAIEKAYQRGVEAEKINTGRIKKRQYENGYKKAVLEERERILKEIDDLCGDEGGERGYYCAIMDVQDLIKHPISQLSKSNNGK